MAGAKRDGTPDAEREGEGMKTCRGCPHIALDQWPQGKQAVRCLYTGNGDRFGRVLHVVRDKNPYPDSVRTPEWCRKDERCGGDDNPSVGCADSSLCTREPNPSVSCADTSPVRGGKSVGGSLRKKGEIQ